MVNRASVQSLSTGRMAELFCEVVAGWKKFWE
jgi:hypothetical protein